MKALNPIDKVTIELSSEIINNRNRLLYLKMPLGSGYSYVIVNTIAMLHKLGWINSLPITSAHTSGNEELTKNFAIVTTGPKKVFFEELLEKQKVSNDLITLVTPFELHNLDYIPNLVIWDISWRSKNTSVLIDYAATVNNHTEEGFQIFINTFPNELFDKLNRGVTVIDFEKDYV